MQRLMLLVGISTAATASMGLSNPPSHRAEPERFPIADEWAGSEAAIARDRARQETSISPGDIILEAIRAVESGDSSLLFQWRRELAGGEGAQGSVQPEMVRQAALGLASAAWVTFQFEEAEERLGEILREGVTGGAGPNDPDILTPFAWIVRGEVAATQARLLRSDSAFSRALAISEDIGAPRARAWSLIRLANVRGRLSGDPRTSPQFLSVAEPLLDPEDSFLRGQFHCARAGNDPSGIWTAEADARTGLAFALRARVRRLHAACLHLLASDQIRRGLAEQALETFREEQEEQKAIGDRSGRAATLQWAGYVLYTLGDFATSRSYLLEAVAEGTASGNLSPVAWAYLSLSGIAKGLGDLAGASAYQNEAETLLTQQGDQWGLTTLRGQRASVAFAAGDWDTARRIWETALTENERSGNILGILGVQTGLLELAIASGDLEAARDVLEAARAMARNAAMGAWDVSFFFHEAEIALKRGDPKGALEALDAFLQPGQFSMRTYRGQMRYAEALALDGRVEDAADFLESSLEALEDWRSGLDAVGLQRYAFQVAEYVPDPDLGVASVLAAVAEAGQVRRAFDLAERQRARDLYEKMVLAEIGRRGEGENLDEDPSIPDPPRPLSADGVLATIPEGGTAVIEFVTGTGGEPTTAFILAGGRVDAVRLPPVDSLERDINLLRSLAASGEEPGPTAARLGEALFAPILHVLPQDVVSLVLVPSGSLHRIPFDLLEPDDEGALLRRFVVSVAPSASVLSQLWAEPREIPTAFLAFGNPDLPDAAAGGLPRLPGAAKEARAVARFGKPGHTRLGGDASEAFFKTSPLDEYGVIHLAAHALVSESSVTGTGLILSPGNGEDGFLSPGDIAQLRLAPGIVVLSACRSARGALVRGEGLQGLTAPLFQAGARTVLATQWAIDDRSGYGLIRDFYRGLADGVTVGESLQAAKLASLERGDPAMVWAAFTAVGDATLRVPAVTPRTPVVPWLGVLGMIILGAVVARTMRRRRA